MLGRTTARTLDLGEDEKGLKVRIDPPPNQWAKDLLVSVKRGDITQMSFGFEVKEEGWIFNENELPLRELKKVRLFDVSLVTYPAYKETDISVRQVVIPPYPKKSSMQIPILRKRLEIIERS